MPCVLVQISADDQEIGNLAVWSVTSAKQGNGVRALRDNDVDTYWQLRSNGRLSFLYIGSCSFKIAESLLPFVCVCVLFGGGHEMQVGWYAAALDQHSVSANGSREGEDRFIPAWMLKGLWHIDFSIFF